MLRMLGKSLIVSLYTCSLFAMESDDRQKLYLAIYKCNGHWMPLHYMAEEAERRRAKTIAAPESNVSPSSSFEEYDKQKIFHFEPDEMEQDFKCIFEDIFLVDRTVFNPRLKALLKAYKKNPHFIELINNTQDDDGLHLVHRLAQEGSIARLRELSQLDGVNMQVVDNQENDAAMHAQRAKRKATYDFLSKLDSRKKQKIN